MVTKEQARTVQDSMSESLREKRVGSGLSIDDKGNWFVRLMLPHEFPSGTFLSEKDGVKIVQEVTGPIFLH